ncbi:MAG: flagellar motor switch phosphatase FliY [Christensenellaceae bacterium]|nr:flagellar motor switch phosphatase FliY [Christensenellaceae bacterium]
MTQITLDGNDIKQLTTAEKDALGEIGNICMGTSATALSTMLDKRVTITTPMVTLIRGNEYLNEFERPVVTTEVQYIQGIDGNTVFLLKKEDALQITSVLLGGDDQVEELYISAISEVMNQMVGAASTALADLIHTNVNISPPVTREISPDEDEERSRHSNEIFIRINFRLEIEGLLTSSIMQLLPYDFGKKLAQWLITPGELPKAPAQKQPESPATAPAVSAMGYSSSAMEYTAPPIEHAAAPATEHTAASVKESPTKPNDKQKVELKAVKYQSFSDPDPAEFSMTHTGYDKNNIGLIIDVPLQVTVLLGKTKKSIKEILELGQGSIIVLDRLAGEMVDILVNGKMFARGEVVVIDDNYGVRITELTNSEKRH